MNKCKNKPTLKELEIIKAQRDEEEKRKYLAINLDICPCCGSPLIEERIEKLDTPTKHFFGLITKYERVWGYRRICSADKKHFEEKYNDLFIGH